LRNWRTRCGWLPLRTLRTLRTRCTQLYDRERRNRRDKRDDQRARQRGADVRVSHFDVRDLLPVEGRYRTVGDVVDGHQKMK
jgi:hypothetical protein